MRQSELEAAAPLQISGDILTLLRFQSGWDINMVWILQLDSLRRQGKENSE